MSYKVEYYKLALMGDGTHGNIIQGSGTAYTDEPIERIPTLINDYLKKENRVSVVTNIERVKGKCLGYQSEELLGV